GGGFCSVLSQHHCQRGDAGSPAPGRAGGAGRSEAKPNGEAGRQTRSIAASGSSSVKRHGGAGGGAGRNCSPIVLGKERPGCHRDGPGKRTGSGCGGQRPGPGTVAPARLARSVGLAGDGEVWPVST